MSACRADDLNLKDMIKDKTYKNILLIAGATRNVGKTTFTCSVIENTGKNHKIIGLKIKTIYETIIFFTEKTEVL